MDVLDIETDWELDGHSLLDGSEATIEPLVNPDVDGPVRGRATATRRTSRYGWDWTALAAVGEHGRARGHARSPTSRSARRAA